MPKLLWIQASPRTGQSYSTRLSEAFVQEFLRRHEGWQSEVLDLFHADLPPFEAPQAKAKYAVMAGQEPADDAGRAWRRVIQAIDHFKAADLYVFASPMWNFGVPYRLKQYFDIIVQPGLTFSHSPEKGYEGLVTGRKAVLALARGGQYPPEQPGLDLQKPYLELILGFIGFADIRTVLVEPTLGEGPEAAEKHLAAALPKARALAAEM